MKTAAFLLVGLSICSSGDAVYEDASTASGRRGGSRLRLNKLRASPINVTALSHTRAVVTTNCKYESDPGCTTHALEGLGGPVKEGEHMTTQANAIPEQAIHVSQTTCKGKDCATVTTGGSVAGNESLKDRLDRLEGEISERERQRQANVTWSNITRLALGALREYDANLLRKAAEAIRERTTPEQIVLGNISKQLHLLSKNMEVPKKYSSSDCCEATTASCLACKAGQSVEEYCGNLEHVRVKGCDMPIDLSKLDLPEVPPKQEEDLEGRISRLEAAMVRKLHKRMDKIEKAHEHSSKVTNSELQLRAKHLEKEIRKELIRKVSKMERARHDRLLQTVKRLEQAIEDQKSGDNPDEQNSGRELMSADADAGANSDDDPNDNADPDGTPTDDDSGILDADNNAAVFHLNSPNDASNQGDDNLNSDCDSSGGLETNAETDTSLPPCPSAGGFGPDKDGSALYAGGPSNVAPTQPSYHKVRTLDRGSLSMELVTDLDDPPPKARANGVSKVVTLEDIVEGSDAPKNKVVTTSLAQSVEQVDWGHQQ